MYQYLIYFRGQIRFHCIDTRFFSSLIDGHLDCFYFFVVNVNAHNGYSFGKRPRNRTAGSYSNSLTFVAKLFSKAVALFHIPTSNVLRVTVFPHFPAVVTFQPFDYGCPSGYEVVFCGVFYYLAFPSD